MENENCMENDDCMENENCMENEDCMENDFFCLRKKWRHPSGCLFLEEAKKIEMFFHHFIQ